MSVFLFACLDQCFLSAFTLLIRVPLDHQLVHDFSVPMLQDKISRILKSSLCPHILQPLPSRLCHKFTNSILPATQNPMSPPASRSAPRSRTSPSFLSYRVVPTSSFFPTFELERSVSILKRFVSTLSVLFNFGIFCQPKKR